MTNIPNVLAIAGSDSGGGAGIQADIKALSSNQAYAATVMTAITAQNTLGVTGIHNLPDEFVAKQMEAVFSDLDVGAVKIGMLSQASIIRTVAKGLKQYAAENIVLDPVMFATSGDLLLEEDAVVAVQKYLMPLADLITPNLYEAAVLSGQNVANNEAEMLSQAQAIRKAGSKAVLIKGGHGQGDELVDLLFSDAGELWLRGPRINTRNTHGTGCSLSSAIAAHLSHGKSLDDAVPLAKEWLNGALAAADILNVGQGSGPVHHFYNLWDA